jgi:hypothetical protein
VATIFIAIFTIVLACVTRKQLVTANNAIKLAREEFISNHHPRLIVKNVWVGGGNIRYIISNTGGTKATVVASRIVVEYRKLGEYVEPTIPHGCSDLGGITIEPGETLRLSCTVPGDVGVIMKFPDTRRIGTENHPNGMDGGIYFAAAITYEDGMMNVRRSCIFRRQWDQPSERFVRLNDQDQEYSDWTDCGKTEPRLFSFSPSPARNPLKQLSA